MAIERHELPPPHGAPHRPAPFEWGAAAKDFPVRSAWLLRRSVRSQPDCWTDRHLTRAPNDIYPEWSGLERVWCRPCYSYYAGGWTKYLRQPQRSQRSSAVPVRRAKPADARRFELPARRSEPGM